MLKHIMLRHHILTAPLFILLLAAFPSQAEDGALTQKLLQCQQEPSALIRLDCYDNVLKAEQNAAQTSEDAPRGVNTIKILLQEQQREEHSTDFIFTEVEGSISPEIILTTPAIGTKPPRPVLAFSCIDKITRMQIILFEPIPFENRSSIILKTNTGTKLDASWFVREQGYVLENSRGLPGIEQIRKLFNAETLLVESSDSNLNGLTFNISTLSKDITPLRQACRW